MRLHGITIQLINRVQTGTDDLGIPIYEDAEPVNVANVLVAPASQGGNGTGKEILDTTNLEGKRVENLLGIPKGDAHDWVNAKVVFFGRTFETLGMPDEGIEDLIPLAWHKKVKVAAYEV